MGVNLPRSPVPPVAPPAAPVVPPGAPQQPQGVNPPPVPPEVEGIELPEASGAVKTTSIVIVGAYLLAGVSFLVVAASKGLESRTDVPTGERAALTSASVDAWVLTFTFLSVGIGLLLLHLIGLGRKQYGILRPLVGGDRRFSTSLTTIGVWTLLIVTALAWLLFRAQLAGADLDELLPPDLWSSYVLLLGGPFAAALLAKGITTYKLANGTLQKTEPVTAEIKQVATNDGGGSDLVDSQYLLFNLVAQVYFVVALLRDGTLPVLPEVLLALTSLTAATYVGNKVAARNAPQITSVSPRTIAPGSEVTIIGSNFDPEGSEVAERIVTVSITGLTETIEVPRSRYTNTIVRFTAPATIVEALGSRDLRVISTAGVQTASEPVTIVP